MLMHNSNYYRSNHVDVSPFLYLYDKLNQVQQFMVGVFMDTLPIMYGWVDGIVDYFKSGFDKINEAN